MDLKTIIQIISSNGINLADIITPILDKVCVCTKNVDNFAFRLRSYDLITADEEDECIKMMLDLNKNRCLYNLILTKPLAGGKFLEALKVTGNDRIIRMIAQSYCKINGVEYQKSGGRSTRSSSIHSAILELNTSFDSEISWNSMDHFSSPEPAEKIIKESEQKQNQPSPDRILQILRNKTYFGDTSFPTTTTVNANPGNNNVDKHFSTTTNWSLMDEPSGNKEEENSQIELNVEQVEVEEATFQTNSNNFNLHQLECVEHKHTDIVSVCYLPNQQQLEPEPETAPSPVSLDWEFVSSSVSCQALTSSTTSAFEILSIPIEGVTETDIRERSATGTGNGNVNQISNEIHHQDDGYCDTSSGQEEEKDKECDSFVDDTFEETVNEKIATKLEYQILARFNANNSQIETDLELKSNTEFVDKTKDKLIVELESDYKREGSVRSAPKPIPKRRKVFDFMKYFGYGVGVGAVYNISKHNGLSTFQSTALAVVLGIGIVKYA